ncbi:MAG: hypothetical protein J7M19_05840 [Planctomycetes bacterium]|nr:hypothetical protein [Planctomycetota bacterium]
MDARPALDRRRSRQYLIALVFDSHESVEMVPVMLKRLSAVSILLVLLAAGVAGASDISLHADRIQTWLEGPTRGFILDGDARVKSPGAALSGDGMVIWFDEEAARRTGRITLSIYSESGGSGGVTRLTGGEGLIVDDRVLTALARPAESGILKRAVTALDEEIGRDKNPAPAKPADRNVRPTGQQQCRVGFSPRALLSQEGVEDLPRASSRTLHEPPVPHRHVGARGAWPAEGRLIATDNVRGPRSRKGSKTSGAVEIGRVAIDSDGYNIKMETVDDVRFVIITGGVEISLADFRMRAQNIVIRQRAGTDTQQGSLQIYAEEDVQFTTPSAKLDASRIFYDYDTGHATLVDAEVYTRLEKQNLPLIMRARKVRALSGSSFEADEAYVTTCEFGLPHYRIQARKVRLDVTEDEAGVQSAMVVAEGNRLYLGDVPVLAWPRLSRDIRQTHTPLQRLEVGNSDDFGNFVRTRWNLLDFLSGSSADSWAARMTKWGSLSGEVDYLAKRGTGAGVEFEYDKDSTSGNLFGYYIKDRGTDADGFKPERDDRGRIKWRHRSILDSLRFDAELSYISERGFLAEYYEKEAKEGKEQETYLYLRKGWENASGSLLYLPRLNDFQSQTEYLGEARFDVVSCPFWDGQILYDSTSRAGNVRFRPDEGLGLGAYQTQRADTWHSVEMPIPLKGGFCVTPFATARTTWYDETADGSTGNRYVASWGAKVGLPAVWRTWDVESAALDIHRLRHIAGLDFTYENTYDATMTPDELLQFDEVDTADTFEAATIHMRHRLQTKREPAEEGAPERVVDLLSLDAEADFFPKPRRDNDARVWSDIRLYGRSDLTDDVSVLADGDYDTYGDRFDKAGVWLRVDHTPRTSWALGSRYIRDVSSSAVTMLVNHEITDLWRVRLLGQYDIDGNQFLNESIVMQRNLHRFVLEISVDYDKGRGDTSVHIGIFPVGRAGSRMSY